MSGEVGTEAAKDVSVGMEPPAIVCKYQELCADVMKCMNMLGILWAGRDHVKRFLNIMILFIKSHNHVVDPFYICLRPNNTMTTPSMKTLLPRIERIWRKRLHLTCFTWHKHMDLLAMFLYLHIIAIW